MTKNHLIDKITAARAEPGMSLPAPFYTEHEIFLQDMKTVLGHQWLLVGHVSRIEKPGQYFVTEIADESIIVIRESASKINAFYNVCRHRGSRICLDHEGQKKRLTCPYHAWTYALDGSLYRARYMPEDFDSKLYGLKHCHLKEWHGLLFLSLAKQPLDFESNYAEFEPLAKLQGYANCRIADRRIYPTRANWKLVVENFIECYHCQPSHREYCAVHSADKLLAFGAGIGSGPEEAVSRFAPLMAEWESRASALGLPIGGVGGTNHFTQQQGARFPIKDATWYSETMDGKPACLKLMGEFQQRDCGQTALSFNPVSIVLASNDYGLMFRFIPRDSLNTDVEMTWLVAKDAVEGEDYDLNHLTAVWDITTCQDKTITENNQAGVLSRHYQPGPYSTLEGRNIQFKQWYLEQLSALEH
jgi:phenylpropionate dioxygenase-like ring-hydroxylating dioxygenase large terminal subunit